MSEAPEQMERPVLQEEIELLNQVKGGIFAKMKESGAVNSPTAAKAFNAFDMFMDTTYLWITQLEFFIKTGGSPTEQAPEDIAEGQPDLKIIKE